MNLCPTRTTPLPSPHTQASHLLYGYARLGLCPSPALFQRTLQHMQHTLPRYELGHLVVAAWSVGALGLVFPQTVTGEGEGGSREGEEEVERMEAVAALMRMWWDKKEYSK